ncbi:hypothetical protein SAMN04487906_0727 [Zhouia amylolytica]|uniref:Uncharacterized protein n=1 Tax=Zhouia amylolytica TaxID=376730 RepID=A0A1I6QMC3_9FLAO|nr:hypothetical protein [Zhouia amylolytica]MCQ0111966.1 hypothetical protein [Zhouia amylolytica]SFS53462.1 hypothetical protein SAMN04487906_0727 [Zhouia amylolytica]
MGLKKKRFTKAFLEEAYPELKRQIDTAAGFDVEILIEWDSLFNEQFMHLYNDTYPKIYFQPLIQAFKSISSDDLGKKALQESLQKVIIDNRHDHHNPNSAFRLKDGVLTVDHSPVLNADKVEERVEVLVELLENNL